MCHGKPKVANARGKTRPRGTGRAKPEKSGSWRPCLAVTPGLKKGRKHRTMDKKRKVTQIIPKKQYDISKEIANKSYAALLGEIKSKIQQAQTRAYLAVNREVILLYWEIGKSIAKRQKEEGYGTKVIERLSADLRAEIPDNRSFSTRNLKYMLKLYKTYQKCALVQQVVAQLPWGHNIVIMDKVKAQEQREYYIREAIANGWSRNILIHQIESGLYERDSNGRKQNNFDRTLPEDLATKAQDMFKDEYNLEMLGIHKKVQERELESRMLAQIRDVLLELGQGFAFVGSQYKVQVEEDDYFIDLLFFHRILQCLVIVELKVDQFVPEYAGKMNFYLNIIDKFVKLPYENPTIGIILCSSKKRTTVEFALHGIDKPMGVAQYYLTKKLPQDLQDKLPSADEIESKIKALQKDENSLALEVGELQLLQVLHKFGKSSPTDQNLQKNTGYSRTWLTRHLNELVKKGYVLKQREGRSTLYSVAPDYHDSLLSSQFSQ